MNIEFDVRGDEICEKSLGSAFCTKFSSESMVCGSDVSICIQICVYTATIELFLLDYFQTERLSATAVEFTWFFHLPGFV